MSNYDDAKANDPHDLIGYDVPAADGGDYGWRLTSYDAVHEDYFGVPIKWSTGVAMKGSADPDCIDVFKITYRYALEQKRKSPAE